VGGPGARSARDLGTSLHVRQTVTLVDGGDRGAYHSEIMRPVQFNPFPRTYVCGLRVHHGLLGCILAVIGAALAAHDRSDFPWPVRDAN
jgi:hypothetical protein